MSTSFWCSYCKFSHPGECAGSIAAAAPPPFDWGGRKVERIPLSEFARKQADIVSVGNEMFCHIAATDTDAHKAFTSFSTTFCPSLPPTLAKGSFPYIFYSPIVCWWTHLSNPIPSQARAALGMLFIGCDPAKLDQVDLKAFVADLGPNAVIVLPTP